MSRVLVTYATRTGATAKVAGLLADELHLLGHEVDVSPVTSAPWPAGYALVVIGSGVRIRRVYGEVVDYLAEHERDLSALPVALFDVSLSPVVDPEQGRERSHAAIERVLERVPSIRPVSTAAFPGAFYPERLGPAERELVRMMGAKEGDYIDEAEVRRWAGTLSGFAARRSETYVSTSHSPR